MVLRTHLRVETAAVAPQAVHQRCLWFVWESKLQGTSTIYMRLESNTIMHHMFPPTRSAHHVHPQGHVGPTQLKHLMPAPTKENTPSPKTTVAPHLAPSHRSVGFPPLKEQQDPSPAPSPAPSFAGSTKRREGRHLRGIGGVGLVEHLRPRLTVPKLGWSTDQLPCEAFTGGVLEEFRSSRV